MIARRIVTAGVLAGMLFAVSHGTAAAEPSWSERFRQVKYRTLEGSDERYSRRELELAVKAAAAHRGASVSYMRCIIDHESGWGVHADNPTSTAYGLFQFLESTWEGTPGVALGVRAQYRQQATMPWLDIRSTASRGSARPAILVAAWLMRNGPSSHWTACR
jgi:hypothetical protein